LVRYRGAFLTTALVMIALIAGMIGTLSQARDATQQRNQAVAARNQSLRVRTLLERLLTFSQPMHNVYQPGVPQASLKPDIKLIDALDAIVPSLEGEFGDQPEVEANVRLTLGKSYFGLSRFAEACVQLEKALTLYEVHHGPHDSRTLDCLNILGE